MTRSLCLRCCSRLSASARCAPRASELELHDRSDSHVAHVQLRAKVAARVRSCAAVRHLIMSDTGAWWALSSLLTRIAMEFDEVAHGALIVKAYEEFERCADG